MNKENAMKSGVNKRKYFNFDPDSIKPGAMARKESFRRLAGGGNHMSSGTLKLDSKESTQFV